jgi:hypothetical protein
MGSGVSTPNSSPTKGISISTDEVGKFDKGSSDNVLEFPITPSNILPTFWKSKILRKNEEDMEVVDWYGNESLHNCFSGRESIDIDKINKIIELYPDMPYKRNQDGRIPLHFALDQSNPNYIGIEILLKHYPVGVTEEDNSGDTPYNLAMKWKSNDKILWLLLNSFPNVDRDKHFDLKYGILADVFRLVSSPKKNLYEDDEDDVCDKECNNDDSDKEILLDSSN